MEDEEEALARALELSRLDHGQQTNQAASAIPHDNKDQSFLPGQLARSDMVIVFENILIVFNLRQYPV